MKTSRNDLHRTVYSNPSNLQRASPVENGRQGIKARVPLERACRKYPEDLPQRAILQRTSPVENGRQGIKARVPLERSCRKYPEDLPQRDILQRTYHKREIEPEITYSEYFRLIRSGNPTKLPSGFTPLRHQQISDQESPYFPIPGRIQERKRLIGKEKEFFQPEEERVRSYDPELVGPSKRSTENNKQLNTLWLQFSQFVEQTQKELERLHGNISRLQEVYSLQTKTTNTLQEAKLSKVSEERKRRLNQVLEEQNNCKRDKEYPDQDIEKLFNVCQNIKPQTHGNVLDNTYHQEDIKPDYLLENKPRSPSQYQDGYSMTYSEQEALKQLPEASSWPKFSVVGEYDHMELNEYIDGLLIDVPSIPDYWITARSNTSFKGHASIWYTKMKKIHGRRDWPW
ncbi:hypothetical protein O181_097248 [Austropuccinia psidii MF-1]|uniref:Uncharacterized protein n=1 Tax=Austropuccinia psidii MF-1 TaxID=1389203 RepID=A0A9Q3J8J4_9BASI|nr:hypothetical protein [Austropuccinia psidii MF-1]